MKTVALTVEKRTEKGKCSNRRLRAAGKIPAVLYGGSETELLAVSRQEFEKSFKHISENILINLAVQGGTDREVLIKDYQRDVVKGSLIHLDFYEIVRGKKLHTKIPVHLSGNPVGVRMNGGLLDQMLYEAQVECLPKDMPEEILVDVSELDVNQSIHVKDIAFPEGVTSLDSTDAVVALVSGKVASEEDAEESEEEAVEEEA